MRRLLLIPVALIGLLWIAMLFSGVAAEKRADFTYVDRSDVSTLDLPKLSYMQDIRVEYALAEGLYGLDVVTMDPIPGCAFPIEVSDDKKVYTFHIRPNAKWTNGDDVLAKDFIFAWKRMINEQGEYAYLLGYIEGAEEYQKAVTDYQPVAAEYKRTMDAYRKNGTTGPEPQPSRPKPDFRKMVGIETKDEDPRYLRIRLKNPTTFFPDLLAFVPFFPAHEASMMVKDEKTGKIVTDPDTGEPVVDPQYTRPPKLVTNGPYRLEKWDFKRKLRLVASDYYWDRGSVKSRVIDVKVIDNPQNAFESYDSGVVDWWIELPGDIGGELLKQGRKDLHLFPSFGTYFYSLNCQDKLPDGTDNPLKKVPVRQALSMAIEKQFIVDNITREGERPATTYIPPGVFKGFESPKGLPFDPARARQLLAEAGYPNGAGLPVFKINFNTEGQHKEIAEYVQREWKKNLNVIVELDGKELSSFRDQLRNKKYAISRASWYGDYNDPSTFTDKYLPDGGNNDADWKNKEFAALCEEATREANADKRLRIFEKAETILLNEAPIIPLYHYVNSGMFRDNVKGLPMNPRNMVMLKSAQVVK